MNGQLQIVVGPSASQAAVTMKAASPTPQILGPEESQSSPAWNLVAALQAAPEALIKGILSQSRVMEVRVDGDLVGASDGAGFRAFALDDTGRVVHQARLFEPSSLNLLVDVAAIWRIASVIVGQKHLADISRRLDDIEVSIRDVQAFQKGEQVSVIKSSLSYLRQVFAAAQSAEYDQFLRPGLERIELDMSAIQGNLERELRALAVHLSKGDVTPEVVEIFANKAGVIVEAYAASTAARLMAVSVLREIEEPTALARVRTSDIRASIDRIGDALEQSRILLSQRIEDWAEREARLARTLVGMAQSVGTLDAPVQKFMKFADPAGLFPKLSASLRAFVEPEVKRTALFTRAVIGDLRVLAVEGKRDDAIQSLARYVTQRVNAMDALEVGSVPAGVMTYRVEWEGSRPRSIRAILSSPAEPRAAA